MSFLMLIIPWISAIAIVLLVWTALIIIRRNNENVVRFDPREPEEFFTCTLKESECKEFGNLSEASEFTEDRFGGIEESFERKKLKKLWTNFAIPVEVKRKKIAKKKRKNHSLALGKKLKKNNSRTRSRSKFDVKKDWVMNLCVYLF